MCIENILKQMLKNNIHCIKLFGSVEVVADKNLDIQKQWGAPWGANISELAL